MDALTNRVDVDAVLRTYGFGIPVGFAAFGIALVYAAAPGLASFASQNRYAQLGILVVVALAAVSLLVAGWALHEIDLSWWLEMRRGDADE